uniref:DNA-directed RNA polymerase subunit beta'' n=1 Tax=Nephroselmis pyriformis TaxID=156128 RepID=A0A8A2H7S4_9CHLO|nr:RNA polymerase beta'' subunit [Nephroselmis pyriformis]QSV37306.1 RNA polymerase beta'' subunit [Nephroselmis pyriformis]
MTFFWNRPADKGDLKRLIAWCLTNQGTVSTVDMLEHLKDTGFHYATIAGISLGIEDLAIPASKKDLLAEAQEQINLSESRYEEGRITEVERFRSVIDTWHGTSERLKDRVIENFLANDPLNPVYIMAFSGARGNISQVRQLVGMRGLMADSQGEIIDFPIRSNFREGLNVTEYIISCYGARKGLVDTALRTANSGYLTRRLVDVAQDVIIRQMDCATQNGIMMGPIYEQGKVILPLADRLLGRLLGKTILTPDRQILGRRNQEISPSLAYELAQQMPEGVFVRSPLTCEALRSICQFCYGWSLAHGTLVHLGEAVGIIAAQSIGEPGTQLTMRTFHTGGVFSGNVKDQLRAPHPGLIQYPAPFDAFVIRTRHGDVALASREPTEIILIHAEYGETRIPLPEASILYKRQGHWVEEQDLLAEFSSFVQDQESSKSSKDVHSRLPGEVYFADLVVQEQEGMEGDRESLTRTAEQSGSLWVLKGQVYNPALTSLLFVEPGDWLEPNSIISHHQTCSPVAGRLVLASSNELEVQQTVLKVPMPVLAGQGQQGPVPIESATYRSSLSGTRSLEWRLPVTCYQDGLNPLLRLESPMYTTPQGVGRVFYSGGTHLPSPGDELLWLPESYYPIPSGARVEVQSANSISPNCLLASTEKVCEAPTPLERDSLEIYALEEGWIQEATSSYVKVTQGWTYILPEPTWLEAPEGIVGPAVWSLADTLEGEGYIYGEWCLRSLGIYMLRPLFSYPIYGGDAWKDHLRNDSDLSGVLDKDNFQGALGCGVHLDVLQEFHYQHGESIVGLDSIELLSILVDTTSLSSETIGHLESGCIAPQAPGIPASLEINRVGTMQMCPSWARDRGLSAPKPLFYERDAVEPQATIGVIQERSPSGGEFHAQVKGAKGMERGVLITTDEIVQCNLPGGPWNHSVGDLVFPGTELSPGYYSAWSGQVILVTHNTLTLRIAQPYRVSAQSLVRANHGDIIHPGHLLFTLIYEELKTGDIVQGLPKIEEILEARITKGFTTIHDSPPEKLESLFQEYMRALEGDSQQAARKSLEALQKILVESVQAVYLAQGVQIADKHVEIIVRQMTSKVLIEDGGYTCLLPGETIELQRIERMNFRNPVKAAYRPIVMGVTKAALTTESFISAASFQETTRVLTQAAIEGKTDWLRGLKENVILGRLIPAGTGFHAQQRFYGTTQYDRIQWSLDPRANESKQADRDEMLIAEIIEQSIQEDLAKELGAPLKPSSSEPSS